VGEGRAYKGLSGNQNMVGVTKISREENLLVLFIFVQTMHFFLIQKSMSSTIKTQFFFLET
jgi:hypothetical protein